MATQNTGYSIIKPAAGRKLMSKDRNKHLPLKNFNDREKNEAEHTPFTPISQTLKGGRTRTTGTSEPQKIVKFQIYLSRTELSGIEENGIEFRIESGKTSDSKTLLYYLSKEYKINFNVFSEMFAIWMISPLLEVQLKPYHRPYECREGWETLLERFADESNLHLFGQDEPILMLRRNVCLTCDREFELLQTHPKCAYFLITDARDMLLLGRLHFLSIDDTVRVAALLFCLQFGNFNEESHDVSFLRNHIDDIFPERTCDSIVAKTIFGKAISKKTVQEDRLQTFWREYSEIKTDFEKELKLLTILTEMSSCYGAAWFSSRIEKKTSRASFRHFGQSFAEVEVNIGINDRFLTIVDAHSSETLLVQHLEELTWQLEAPKGEKNPFLILNISCEEEINDGNNTTIDISDETALFLKITGNQTILIDALLKNMQGRWLERASSSSSSSDSSSGGHASLIKSKLDYKNHTASRNRKLCLAKFKDGICTEVAGSFKDVYSHGQTI